MRPSPRRWRSHYALHAVRLSVCLSVPCLPLTWQRKTMQRSIIEDGLPTSEVMDNNFEGRPHALSCYIWYCEENPRLFKFRRKTLSSTRATDTCNKTVFANEVTWNFLQHFSLYMIRFIYQNEPQSTLVLCCSIAGADGERFNSHHFLYTRHFHGFVLPGQPHTRHSCHVVRWLPEAGTGRREGWGHGKDCFSHLFTSLTLTGRNLYYNTVTCHVDT